MPLSEHCQALADPNSLTVALAAVLVVGILLSYVPQHVKILGRRSSEGLSPWWVLLGGLSSIAAIGNIMTLPTSRQDMACCKELDPGQCAAALLGVTQIGVQWTSFMFIVLLYLVFFPSTVEGAENMESSTASLTRTNPAKRRDPLIVGAAIFISVFVVGLVSVILVFTYPKHTQTWADILGTISGVLAAIQYLPQIYYTYRLRDLKSLSVVTLLVQAPGAFLFALSLGLRVGWEGWSTWAVYCVTGLLQIVLLLLAATFCYDEQNPDPMEDSSDEQGDEHEGQTVANGATERTALLSKTSQQSPNS